MGSESLASGQMLLRDIASRLAAATHARMGKTHACGQRYAVRDALKVNPGRLYFHLPVICHLRVLPAVAYPRQ